MIIVRVGTRVRIIDPNSVAYNIQGTVVDMDDDAFILIKLDKMVTLPNINETGCNQGLTVDEFWIPQEESHLYEVVT